MKKYKTIKALHDDVKAGKIDESKLRIVLDNDCTSFYLLLTPTDDDLEEIEVKEANGYYDIDKLYPLLFPEAEVEWC